MQAGDEPLHDPARDDLDPPQGGEAGGIEEVGARGAISLQPPAELAQALAQAGGLNEFASESKIFVLRRFPQFQRIRFTYEAIVQNQGGAAMFPLRTGDVIVVE
jgi:protein involved in polysaccharide export with SLBB domain